MTQKAEFAVSLCSKLRYFTLTDDELFYHVTGRFNCFL